MARQDEKAVVRRYVEEVLNGKNLAAMDELVANENLKQRVTAFRSAFPDLRIRIDEMLAEDDKVAVHLTGRGTHTGPLRGIEPTGKEATLPCTAIYRVSDGKIVDFLVTWDLLSLVQ